MSLVASIMAIGASPASAVEDPPLPQEVKCNVLDSSCKKAKEWYKNFWDYSVSTVSAAPSADTLDGLRRLTAMAVGGAYKSKESGILVNLDTYVRELNRTRAGKACAMRSLYAVADDVRRDKRTVDGVRKGFSLIKKAAKSNQVIKAYAKIGYDTMGVVEATAQLARARDLYNLYIDCTA